MTPQQAERIKAKIEEYSIPEPNSGCWLWLRYQNGYGYAKLCFSGRPYLAHRLAYEAYRGQIPDGLDIDHKCRVRCCVNPAHLEPVTRKVNLRRGVNANAAKTHCLRGHPLSGDNLHILPDGYRSCRACMRLHDRKRMPRRRRR